MEIRVLRYLYMCVHSSIIHNRKNMEASKGELTDDWINKIWTFIYSVILFSLRKEANSDTCYSTDKA